jgi:uncharacterized protein YqjF (DUF2071 family)
LIDVGSDVIDVAPKSGRRPFLTAQWSDLLLVTYAVPTDVLEAHLHPGLTPDLWSGSAHVSLVAFRFLDTRVLGVSVPGHRDFPEVNLRAYVRHGGDRGVMFVRELVPSRLVAAVARLGYNEPYAAAPITVGVEREVERASVRAQFDWKFGGMMHRLAMTGSEATLLPATGSDAYLTKEHEWGFGRTRGGRLLRYRVSHPEWPVRTVTAVDLSVDFGRLYGPGWEFLNAATPTSTLFAVGSPVAVGWPD